MSTSRPRQTPGNYVPLDVNYARDRTIRAVGALAELLFLRGNAHCKLTKSGGFIPEYDLPSIAVGIPAAKKHVKLLLEVHAPKALWVPAEGGWQVRSWERWNGSETASSQGGRLGNHQRWHVAEGVVNADCELCQEPSPPSRPRVAPRSQPDSPPMSPPESEGKGREGKERTTTREADASAEFEEFWKAYPRKTAKRNAEKAWKAAIKRAEPSVILAGLRRAKFSEDPQFIAHPATWLNGDRWADQAQTSLTLLPASDGFTAAELDQILGPPRPLPQPPRGLSEDAMWEWEQQTRREQRAERVRQANVKLGRSA